MVAKLNGNAGIQCKEAFRKSDIDDYEGFLERLAKGLRIKHPRINSMRLFNSNGMELFEQDMEFLKDKEVLYVSMGEDFDIKSYYSEYQVIKELGSGGFGKVILGENKITGQKVAIKTTYAQNVDSPKDLDGLYSEIQTLKSLKHPNIVSVLNGFVDRKTKQAVMIMEYLEGGELLDFVNKRGKLSEKQAFQIFSQVLSAVRYCHFQKIIHRDLKLENILRESHDSDVVKVLAAQ